MNNQILQHLWKPLLLAATIAFVYASVFHKLGRDWWNDPNYSHGLLVPFIIGYILWAKRDELMSAIRQPLPLLGGAIVFTALLGLWVGIAGAELYVQRISLLWLLIGVVIYFWGLKILRLSAVPLFLLLLSIPIPTIVLNKIAFPLQLFASRCAVAAMRVFDIPVLREGNVIELMPLNSTQIKKLEVVEACSGIRSLMTLVTLAVVFAYFTHPKDPGGRGRGGFWGTVTGYGFWHALIIVSSAIPIAIFTNAMRVSSTGILARYFGTEVADGFFHSFSGWVMYIAALLQLFAVSWVLDKIADFRKRRFKSARTSLAGGGDEGATSVGTVSS